MNEESLKIIVNQKRDIDNLHEYVDAGFKVIFDLVNRDSKEIKFLSFCFGAMIVVIYKQGKKIKKLESKINQTTKEEQVDELEKVKAE